MIQQTINITILVLGLVLFTNAILVKFDIWSDLERYAMKQKYKAVFNLLNCRFCVSFWIGVLFTLIAVLLSGFFWLVLIVPFVVSGLTQFNRNNGL